MAITLSVTQSSGKLLVYANNTSGTRVAIIDHIVVSVSWSGGSSWHTWHYQDDFYFGSGRVPTSWAGLMVEKNYSGGAAKAHATAYYWEVDEVVKSPVLNVT